MPLRSVEAATRDDAIAAAREQFGPQARIVGVRRVRSGGVLGFFATERYVAEVAPDAGRPPVPAPARGSSPLASAAPATAAPSSSTRARTAAPSSARARATAPARNGAAAYAAEAVRYSEPERPVSRPTATPSRPAEPLVDEARVSELVGLLGGATAEPQEAPAYGRATRPRVSPQRASFPKASWAATLDDTDDDTEDDDATPRIELPASSAPSPFTAALARMVAGDRDVRQAVAEAVEEANEQPGAVLGRGATGLRPVRSGLVRSADTAVWPRAARQEEETVGDQVIAPPSMPAAPSVELPTWAAEPEAVAAPDSSREEAIAEILRSALAQGHSDEALTGILRKVLDGASPQAALPAPEPLAISPGHVMADNVVAEPQPVVAEPSASVGPVVVTPTAAEPTAAEPTAIVPAGAESTSSAPAAVESYPEPVAPVEPVPPAAAPRIAPSTFAPLLPAPPVDIWGAPTSTPLWGDPVTPPRAVSSDAPIWAEVVLAEPHATPPVVEAPVHEAAVTGALAIQPPHAAAQITEPPAVAGPAVDSPASELLGDTTSDAVAGAAIEVTAEPETGGSDTDVTDLIGTEEPEVAETRSREEGPLDSSFQSESVDSELLEAPVTVVEMAPLLARTASDPAPLPMSMSLDATSVMPPLSLLPPLPSSRGRGRPPVPPASARPAVPPAGPPASESQAAPSVAVEAPEPVAPPTPSLATVTRLPVAPLTATPPTPEMTELEVAGPEEAVADVVETTAPAPAAAPAPPPEAEAAPVAISAPTDVAGRLAALGLPTRLLGPGFATDVQAHGTYAALTRALGLSLPPAPELPGGAGEVLFVVGPGVETLRAARSLAASLRLDPDRVQWATRGDLAGLAPEGSRMTTIDAAIGRRQHAATAGTVTIVAVDVPLRTDAYWMAQMLAIWSPVAVWAVVEATRKPEDLEPWIADLARVDALIVQDTDLSADPAAVLHRVAAPVAVLDGVRATPHRWASLLCERLETART